VLFAFTVETVDRRRDAKERRVVVDAASTLIAQVDVREIPSKLISAGIDRLLSESTDWVFRGGSGRYFRYATLPALALVRERDVPVTIGLLDPNDRDLCQRYAEYRNLQRGELVRRPDEGDFETIEADLLSTIYAAAWYSQNSRIEVELVLLRSFSPLRYDIGTTGLYITIADPAAPGLYAKSGSWYFNSVRDEMMQASHGHPSVEFPAATSLFPGSRADVTPEVVEEALNQMKLRDPLIETTQPLWSKESPRDPDYKAIAAKVFPSDPK
jgi:hypothetical protein